VSAIIKKNAKLELAGGDFYLIQLTQKKYHHQAYFNSE
jgi:hypothetical protein